MPQLGRSTEAKSRKVTPPSPSYMSNEQFARYLADLRSNRIARPGGARPQPAGARPEPSNSRASTVRSSGRFSPDAYSQTESLPGVERALSKVPSIASRYSTSSNRARHSLPPSTSVPLKPSEVVPSATYIERGQRWMEKEEATSLRDAMEEMDIQKSDKASAKDKDASKDTRLYDAALDEAAELVWQHQHGVPRPQPDAPYRYRSHLRKNSYAHARTASVGSGGRFSGTRSFSGSSAGSDVEGERERSSLEEQAGGKARSYGSVGSRTGPPLSEHRRRSSVKRNISGEVGRPFSGDQIWEEPESSTAAYTSTSGRASSEKLGSRGQNPTNRVRFETSPSESAVVKDKKTLDRVEIHRNPPTRSRNPQYTANTPSAKPDTEQDKVPRKNGVELRSQDIREATSMRLKDRSPNLPEPTAVSDSPGRPIVSFDADWKAPDESTDTNPERSARTTQESSRYRSHSPVVEPEGRSMEVPSIVVAEEGAPVSRALPSIAIDEPDNGSRGPVPSINVPVIAVDEVTDTPSIPGVPVIVAPDDRPSTGGCRPLPNPGAARRGPHRAQRPRGHWSPDPRNASREGTLCHECGFPIEGKFVALGRTSERFHPQCFSCFSCGTGLEAMEISPEPENVRRERLDRIRRRAGGEILEEIPGMTMAEDGDDRLRFFCHLDWHELFAPRCKHCATPILGEHVVALGEHWHYGHFFCAECGDPFEHGMTHIEKDGYAWCINCQTKRTERRAPKCRMCKKAVIGQYIQALGGEWHETCFRCAECQGGFNDGQIFTKEVPQGTIVLCTGCRARELKA